MNLGACLRASSPAKQIQPFIGSCFVVLLLLTLILGLDLPISLVAVQPLAAGTFLGPAPKRLCRRLAHHDLSSRRCR